MGKKKRNPWKRALALLMSLCMIWSMAAFTVLAEEPEGEDNYPLKLQ